MRSSLLRLYVKCKVLTLAVQEEHGQDLVEYAAVIALVVLGLTAGMTTLANGINTATGSLSNSINNTIG